MAHRNTNLIRSLYKEAQMRIDEHNETEALAAIRAVEDEAMELRTGHNWLRKAEKLRRRLNEVLTPTDHLRPRTL